MKSLFVLSFRISDHFMAVNWENCIINRKIDWLMISSQCDAPTKTGLCAHTKWCTKVPSQKKTTIKEFKLIKIQLRFFLSHSFSVSIKLSMKLRLFNILTLVVWISFSFGSLFSFSLFVWTVWLKANEMRAFVRTFRVQRSLIDDLTRCTTSSNYYPMLCFVCVFQWDFLFALFLRQME